MKRIKAIGLPVPVVSEKIWCFLLIFLPQFYSMQLEGRLERILEMEVTEICINRLNIS